MHGHYVATPTVFSRCKSVYLHAHRNFQGQIHDFAAQRAADTVQPESDMHMQLGDQVNMSNKDS